MRQVLIDGEIGYDWWDGSGVTARKVEEQLEGLASGEDIEVVVNSVGGSVYEGVRIFNIIRKAAKTHPVSVKIDCLAMSMASYIALAARTVDRNAKITVCDNSIVMIHNPWTVACGDYRDLQREADYLQKLAAMYGSVHAYVSGRSDSAIRQEMDDEIFFVGREIIDAGFANDFDAIVKNNEQASRGDNSTDARATLIINAKSRFDHAVEKIYSARDKKELRNELQKAVALFQRESLGAMPPKTYQINPGASASSKNRGGTMKPEELLAQDKNCYDAVFALGETRALEKERFRINAHITLGKKCGSMDIAIKHIENGRSTLDEDVNAEYLAAAMDRNRIEARNEDNPGPLNLRSDREDGDKITAAFKLGAQGKTLKGMSWER
jgi:ATP-dependent protease ClpP protease subunit